jgi:hypothetical protein
MIGTVKILKKLPAKVGINLNTKLSKISRKNLTFSRLIAYLGYVF